MAEDDDDNNNNDVTPNPKYVVNVFLRRTFQDDADELKLLKRKQVRRTGKSLMLHVDPYRTLFHTQVIQFCQQVVDALPMLETIEISTCEIQYKRTGRMAIWSARLLADVLQMLLSKKRKITSARLCFIGLTGQWNDFADLAERIKELPSLKKFNLDKISLQQRPGGTAPPATHQGCWLDPIVQALGTLPHLQHVRILGTSDFTASDLDQRLNNNNNNNNNDNNNDSNEAPVTLLQNSTLSQLCQSRTLRSLCLIHFNLNDENVTQMAKHLEQNPSLKELDIDCTLGTKSSCALTKMIERNTVLEDLNLCVRCKNDEALGDAETNDSNAQELARQKELLAGEDEINMRIAKGVGKSNLVNFALFRGRISTDSQDAFRTMIAEQYRLESLTLYTGDEALNRKLSEDPVISFWLKVNKFDRRRLMNSQPPLSSPPAVAAATAPPAVTNSKSRSRRTKKTRAVADSSSLLSLDVVSPERRLVDTLAKAKGDVGCIFYFLNLNPSICNRAIQKMNEQERDNRKRPRNNYGETDTIVPSKRTRLYRAAKYKGVCYKS